MAIDQNCEQAEALKVRASWMRLMGYSEEDIQDACASSFPASLAEELKSLAAAEQFQQQTTSQLSVTEH